MSLRPCVADERSRPAAARALLVGGGSLLANTLREGLAPCGLMLDVESREQAALKLARAVVFHVVVVDGGSGQVNARAVCRGLRTSGIWSPLMVLGGSACGLDEVGALEVGADDYLARPWAPLVLLARLRALIRRGSVRRARMLRAGDLSMDPVEWTAARGTTRLDLTPRELELLHQLIRRPGETLTRDELLCTVWGTRHPADSVVATYVGYLRRKIDEPFGRASLQTVRGLGYRLDSEGG